MNIITVTQPHSDPSLPWSPVKGRCFANVDAPSDTVREEAIAIMSLCLSPERAEGHRTGLVIGYVQSGKTSSFTSVAALARDNGFQLVIVISGTSKNLYAQSADRVVQALTKADRNGWIPFYSHDIRARAIDQAVQDINSSLAYWRFEGMGDTLRKTVLICAMKNATHLQNVLDVLRCVQLSGVKALVIDDEADQASMNFARTKGGESAIYSILNGIRQTLPHATYLQYTATPQAPLLIRVDDALSPEFCKVLTAGSSFSGPQKFFDTDAARLLAPIPPADVTAAQAGTAPRSLQQALAFFLLGVAAHMANPAASGEQNRTMMVHPSQQTAGHEGFRMFVHATIGRWRAALSPSGDASEKAAMRGVFQTEFEVLGARIPGLSFDELWARVGAALEVTTIETMNATAGGTRSINWHLPYHIVIGGMMLDRGYTVEGLTVTYMPREQAHGTADNIQQRARWFGYKERYLGYCRVWLTGATVDTYKAILEHEEQMREALRNHTGPLAAWRRRFFLEPSLQPTRTQVVKLQLLRGCFAHAWFEQKAPHGEDCGVTARNWAAVNTLLEPLVFKPFGKPEWTDIQHGEIASEVPLALVCDFLQSFICETESDAAKLVGVTMQVSAYLHSNPHTHACVVKMSSRGGEWKTRTRLRTDRLHQGKNPSDPAKQEAYPGDAQRRGDALTVQLFRMEAGEGDEGVPALAVYVPSAFRKPWISEVR